MSKKIVNRVFDFLTVILIFGGIYTGFAHNLASGIGLIVVACILSLTREHEQLKQRVKQLESKQNKFL